jgi:arginine utilization regulatory protein
MADHANPPSTEKSILSEVDFLRVFDAYYSEGVIITDRRGVVLFTNRAQKNIDHLEPSVSIGKHVTELYRLSEESSMIMRCLNTGKPILNQVFFYRTPQGGMRNALHSVFPLVAEDRLAGAICFVQDRDMLEKDFAASAALVRADERNLGNGTRFMFADLIGADPEFLRCVERARAASDSSSPIMLVGETGTGKELFAQGIHNHSVRRSQQFVAVNCAAIPDTLQESVLFGTVRGAFTGAVDKPGLFESACSGTLFLDELDAMSSALQAKLLRVLQDRKVRRVGSSSEVEVDLKIVSAISQDPRRSIEEGALRNDLFYRLGVVLIHIPPLKERKGDIETLARHFISKLNFEMGTGVEDLSENVLGLFQGYEWPGNVRELEHVIESAMHEIGTQRRLRVEHLGKEFRACTPADKPSQGEPSHPLGPIDGVEDGSEPAVSLGEFRARQERALICRALEDARGNVSLAARKLGISRQLLHYKVRKMGLDPASFR